MWRCSGGSNQELVFNLQKNGIVTARAAIDALLGTDRGFYIRPPPPYSAYDDSPQSLGHGVTISAPHMHASALEYLADQLKPGNKCLDVGVGSGYLLACMARMVNVNGVGGGNKGLAVGIDIIDDLVVKAKDNLNRDNKDLIGSGQVIVQTSDGWRGAAKYGPFDAIHVGAAAEEIPQALVEQLNNNGKMIIPVGPQGGDQHLLEVVKDKDGKVSVKTLFGVRYVPLVKKN